MRFGVSTKIGDIELVEKIGFDYLETSAASLAELGDAEFGEIAGRVGASSIKIECLNMLFPKSMSLIGPRPDWSAAEKYLHGIFSRASRLGAKTFVFGSGKSRGCPEGMPFGDGYRQLVEVTKKTGRIAAAYGFTIAVEPLNRSESNMINSLGEGAMLVSDAGLDNVRLLADSYHMFKEGEPMQDIARVGTLHHVHVAVLEGRGFPVAPDAQLGRFIETLVATGYANAISIEGKTENFAQDATQALAMLRSLTEGKK